MIGFIFYLSAENGTSSSASSGKVGEIIASSLNAFGANINPQDSNYKMIIRKLVGHFGLFLATSGSLVIAILFMKNDNKKKYILLFSSLIIGVAVAFLSEYVQSFALDRGPSVKDALIDTAGYLTPIIIYICVKFFVYFKDKRSGSMIEL